jgi:hypothetical protein
MSLPDCFTIWPLGVSQSTRDRDVRTRRHLTFSPDFQEVCIMRLNVDVVTSQCCCASCTPFVCCMCLHAV